MLEKRDEEALKRKKNIEQRKDRYVIKQVFDMPVILPHDIQ